MFIQQVQQILDQAKRDSWAQGEKEITLEALVMAAQSGGGRILLSQCSGISIEDLRQRYAPRQYEASMEIGAMALSREVEQVMTSAEKLAQEVPDRVHPGYIGLRHLVCALVLSHQVCEILKISPVSEKEVRNRLIGWYEIEEQSPELSRFTERLRALRADLLKKVIGQDHAVHSFVEGLFNSEIVANGEANRKRPRAIFIFAGPPGVGKTYLAELGAEALKRPFRRFDMSAYADHQAHMALVGFSPSFQAAQAGLLTGFVEKNPDALLLFDEIEKASTTTINLFLQILDAGRLEDKFTGKEVSFKDTVLIFTTNVGYSLYDRPNKSGITVANASFHRRTILDALRTEKSATGEPSFPAAICSRIATGYPILFNHLGINELQRIAQVELERVGSLLEQQYTKSITCDPLLALALVMREGGKTDARTVRSQSTIFVQTELFKFSELFTRQRLERVWQSTDTIHFGFEIDHDRDQDAFALFEPTIKPKILLVASEELGKLYKEHITEMDWLVADSSKDALQILAGSEVDLVLLDLWVGSLPHADLRGTVDQFDFTPLGARVIAEGQESLRLIHERLPELPVYLLEIVEELGREGDIDEGLLLACMKNGGARGECQTAFTDTKVSNWEERRRKFLEVLKGITLHIYREKKASSLAQENRVLSFDTVPMVSEEERRLNIRLRDFRLTRAVSAEDASELIQDVERPDVKFSDVFGADAAKDALQFIVDWLKSPRHYAALGVRPPKGILLTGSPGTGKTMLARALAGEADVAFLVASGTDFVTIWQGSGPQNVRNLFERGRRYAPAIIFIDEIDAIGKRRMGIEGGGRSEESTLNALLTEMDGFNSPTLRPVILLAASNLAEHLDEALRRRFDREIDVLPPDKAARMAYLRYEFSGRKLAEVTEATIEGIANRSAGMTISDLRRVVNEAAVMAARKQSPLTDVIFEEAFEKMRMGETNAIPDEQTLERIARHESGHAIIGWLTGNAPVQVTIIGRGSAGGYVEKEAQENKVIYTRTELENIICQAMGGRAAEMLYYGEAYGPSTGVASDLRVATHWAERMIREFGMSPEVGLVFVDERLLRDGGVAIKVNEAAEKIVRAQFELACQLLQKHRKEMDALSSELLARNRITQSDLEEILKPRKKK
ncbi:MAG: AAA family ATPase [Chloroflexota bacterium]